MERPLLETLIIEDNPADTLLLEALLEKDPQVKYIVRRADRLRAGLAILQDQPFDVILLDLDLPDSQGLATFEQVRAAVGDVPVVVLSGLMDEDTALKAVQAGAQDYLVKGGAGWEFLSRSIRYAIERNNLRRSLHQSEEKYRLLFESNPLPMWIYDIETLRFLKVNEAAIDHYGYSEEEFMAMTIKDIRPQADIPRLMEKIAHIVDPLDHAGIWTHLKKNGSPIQVEIISHLVEFNGRRAEMILANDVTERLRAEATLRNRELLLQEAQKIARLGHYRLDIVSGYWESSEILNEIFGIGPEHLKDVQSWLGIIHPDQREEMSAYFRDHVLEKRNPFNREYRVIRRSDGQERWVHGIGQLEFDHEGNPVRMIGTIQDITERKKIEVEVQHHLAELEALYENGLAVGRLLDPREIGKRIIETFERHLSWHHVAIRLISPDTDALELIAFNQPGLKDAEKAEVEQHFRTRISRIGQGLSGWVAQTGEEFRTGNVHAHPQYVGTYPGIRSGLYMPLKIGDRILGVISVESESPDAFTVQDERLLATLANQAAIAFENARLYQSIQQERERFSELFENSPVATWLEDFSEVIAWMEGLKAQGVANLREYLAARHDEYRKGVSLIRILDVNQSAVVMNGARDSRELIRSIHELMGGSTPVDFMLNELELLWRGYTSFGFEMSSLKMDGSQMTGIMRLYVPVSNNKPDYTRVIVTSVDITDRVNIENQLRASEVHYRELADSITDIFFELDQDLRYSHWNKASEMLTGVPGREAIGRSMGEFFGVSGEQAEVEGIYREVLKTQKPTAFETVFQIHGLPRTFEINAYPSTRGVSVVARDVTERKRSESLLQKRFELMEYSAEHSLEEIMQRSLDEINAWTQSAMGFFHMVRDDQLTLGMQVWSTSTYESIHAPRMEEQHKSVDQAGVWAEAVRSKRPVVHNEYASLPGRKGLPEGHIPLTREMIVPIIRNEKVVAVIGMCNKPIEYTSDDLEIAERFADYIWDITERKQMVMELAEERNQLARRVEERTADLSRANSNLARALRVKDEFLANMSHELRTPLNAILGLSESLAEQIAGPLNQKQLKYINTISESGHHLLSLINDILDLAKIEAGQITLDINKVDVNAVSQASLRMIRQLAQKKNLDVSLEVDANVNTIWADDRRLKQMLVNLLSNAVKFTPESGRIGLQVHGQPDDNKVTFTVWDTGIGIKESDFQHLFQPFMQLDAGLARESSGTGLGLALVAQMARLHGGSVGVQSERGRGSRFTIVLPWEPSLSPDHIERAKATGRLHAVRPGQRQQTILLIEDTQEVVMMIADYLETSGYKVVTAQDGLDGITQARLSHPDLILMDVQMPRMDGLEATQKLRLDPEFRRTPIIALTALAMPADRERCLAAGMNEYISKPVNLRALVKTIQGFLSAREEKNGLQ